MIEKKYLQTPKGTRDFFGNTARQRQKLIRFFQDNFEKIGFEPLITPNIEYKELVDSKNSDTYGDELKLVYNFKDMGGRDLVLKYDQTVPLVRFVASNPALAMPYKRYAIERAYRFENVQKGRYREFWQCDIDIVGSSSTKSDSFIINAVIDISKKLGFTNIKVLYNNRKIIFEILNTLNIDPNNYMKIIRLLDKIDKQGINKIKTEISNIISEKKTKELINILNKTKNINNLEKLESIKKYISKENYLETKSILDDFVYLDIDKYIDFNLFLTRGLDYYTSSIFELVDKDTDIGSLGGGGRYDNMIEQFCGRKVPAIGFAFGFERIFDILEKRNILKLEESTNNIFIISPNKDSKEILKINKILLDNNIYSLYDFSDRSLSKQLQYAIKNNFKYIIICELDELQKNKYKFKDINNNTEEVLDINQIINILKSKLIY
jgi:histidyl-tRNA synthetase